MSWSSALSGLQWAILIAIPPLVFLLYFLKLRRQPLEVSSTYLWKKAIEDFHVNSLWQRLRRNLLLLLQLLFLVVLILACLRPSLSGTQEAGRRWVVMIDNSASMASNDSQSYRLGSAKNKALDQISQMNRGDVAMVMAFSDRADIKQGFTSDKKLLRSAIESIATTERLTDIREAMRAAAGLANPGRVNVNGKSDAQVAEPLPATVFVYSDGSFTPYKDFDRGNLSIEYVPIGDDTIDNISIDAFAITEKEDNSGEYLAYARLTNHGSEQQLASVSLYVGNQLLDATETEISAAGERGLSFELPPPSETPIGYRLVIDRSDQLALDNTAYAAIQQNRKANVIVFTPGNEALITALSTPLMNELVDLATLAPVAMNASGAKAAEWDKADLIIYDQCVPAAMPRTNTLFIGRVPPVEIWKFNDSTLDLQIVDVERDHPITSLLELSNVRIAEGHSIIAPEGAQTLIRADSGPVFCVAPRDSFQDAVLGFSIVENKEKGIEFNTDWPRKRSFPLFVLGAIEYLAGVSGESTGSSTRPGQAIRARLASQQKAAFISSPVGEKIEIERGSTGDFVFGGAEKTGLYRWLDEKDRLLQVNSVNLFSSDESRLAVMPEISVGEEAIAATTTETPARVDVWRWLLLVGFGLLLTEWVVYNRRVFV